MLRKTVTFDSRKIASTKYTIHTVIVVMLYIPTYNIKEIK